MKYISHQSSPNHNKTQIGYIQYIPRNMHTVLLCFVVVMQSFIMNSHEVFIHIHQGCFAGTGAIVRLPQCQWSKPDGYGKISQCITTTKHSKAKTVCIFLGIYCNPLLFVTKIPFMLLYTLFNCVYLFFPYRWVHCVFQTTTINLVPPRR